MQHSRIWHMSQKGEPWCLGLNVQDILLFRIFSIKIAWSLWKDEISQQRFKRASLVVMIWGHTIYLEKCDLQNAFTKALERTNLNRLHIDPCLIMKCYRTGYKWCIDLLKYFDHIGVAWSCQRRRLFRNIHHTICIYIVYVWYKPVGHGYLKIHIEPLLLPWFNVNPSSKDK